MVGGHCLSSITREIISYCRWTAASYGFKNFIWYPNSPKTLTGLIDDLDICTNSLACSLKNSLLLVVWMKHSYDILQVTFTPAPCGMKYAVLFATTRLWTWSLISCTSVQCNALSPIDHTCSTEKERRIVRTKCRYHFWPHKTNAFPSPRICLSVPLLFCQESHCTVFLRIVILPGWSLPWCVRELLGFGEECFLAPSIPSNLEKTEKKRRVR